MNNLKRTIKPQGLLIILCLTVILLAAGSQKALSAEPKPYLIKINRAYNTITVYEKDEKGAYTIPVKAMACSVGLGGRTITGTFQTKEKYRWKLLMGDVWGQYATRIVGGILFHSVYYYKYADPSTLATAEFNKLGSAASHGCVRLTVADAKWIYDNCAIGTTVIVYDDKKNPGPLGKPETFKIPNNVRWDPTDPSEKNPYYSKTPVISGVKNLITEYGKEVDLLKGVKAKSTLGADITSQIQLGHEVDYHTPGEYIVTYSVTDILNKTISKTGKVTVKEPPYPPEFVGISDKLVNGLILVDEAFALEGVDICRGKNKLDKNLIKVTIKQTDKTLYTIYYAAKVDNQEIAAEAKVYVDSEPPVITGVADLVLNEGEIPTQSDASEGVTVSDNYSSLENIKFTVTVRIKKDGSNDIYYEAVDEAGNVTSAIAKIIY